MKSKYLSLALLVMLIITTNAHSIYATNIYSDVKQTDWYYSYMEPISKHIAGYPDGSFRGNDEISIAEFLTLVIKTNDLLEGTVATTPWFRQYVDAAIANNIIAEDDYIDYSRSITRGEIASVLAKIPKLIDKEVVYPEVVHFNDEIPLDNLNSINLMVEQGIIVGYEDVTYRVNNKATRAEAVVIIIRALDESFRVKGNNMPIAVRLDKDNKLKIKMQLPNYKQEIVEFDYGGINNIYAISRIHNGKKVLNIGTDLVGPYVMFQNDLDASNGQFTGGWHGSNGDGTGAPTGNTIRAMFLLDDKTICRDKWILGDSLRIVVENNIKGNNTIHNILNEVVTYNVSNQNIDVKVKATATQNIVIDKYYGMQTQNHLWSSLMYCGQGPISCRINSHSMDARSFVLLDDEGYYLRSSLNLDGLGGFARKANWKPTCFTTDYGKTYFNLVNGLPLELDIGESFSWSGSYYFGFE